MAGGGCPTKTENAAIRNAHYAFPFKHRVRLESNVPFVSLRPYLSMKSMKAMRFMAIMNIS